MTGATIAAARAALAAAATPYVQPFTSGTMRLVLFAPCGHDDQTPHRQDELYIVTRGSAVLVRSGERIPAASGDAIFVPAGAPHRFEAMTDDFETWAIFWGPSGGE